MWLLWMVPKSGVVGGCGLANRTMHFVAQLRTDTAQEQHPTWQGLWNQTSQKHSLQCAQQRGNTNKQLDQ